MANVNAMKLAAVSMSAGLTALVIKTASPSTLVMLEIALIGALYVIRSREGHRNSSRLRKAFQV